MDHIASLAFLIFFASVKFFLSAPLAVLQYKLHFWESVFFLTIGGWIGVFVFAFLSRQISGYLKLFNERVFSFFSNKPKRKFSYRKRAVVKVKVKYGLAGLVLLTPVAISIPIGAFLAQHYYPGRKTIGLLLLSVFMWALVLSAFYVFMASGFISAA